MEKSETMWAIVGDCGLYCGTYLTRKDAIKDFVNSYFTVDGQEAISQRWRELRRKGNRAVKVTVTWDQPND